MPPFSTQKSPPLWLLLPLIGFTQLSETIYSPALPNIAHAMATSNSWVQWTLTLYFMGFAFGVFIWGRLSDSIGRRLALLGGLSFYLLGSLLCLTASHITALLIARAVQGFGASAGSVVVQIIAREALSDKKRHTFFSSMGFVLAFSITLGPFLGGYLTQWFHWQANFMFLVFLGVLLIALCGFCLPETKSFHANSEENVRPITEIIGLFLKDKNILLAILLVSGVNGMLFSYYAEAPFLFIKLLKLTPGMYGWLGSGIALAALLGSLSANGLLHRFQPKKVLQAGGTIMLISSMALALLASVGVINAKHQVLSGAVILFSMMGIVYGGFGFIIPITLTSALKDYQKTLGTAGALFGLGYYVGIALITWLMGWIHNGGPLPMPWYFFSISLLCLWATRQYRM